MIRSNVVHFLSGAIIASIVATIATTSALTQNTAQTFEEYARRVELAPVLLDGGLALEAKGVMTRMMLAHKQRDGIAEVAELGDNYSFTQIHEEGPVVLAEGREIAEEMSVNLYESEYMKSYRGVVAHPIAVVGNIGIVLDIETYEFADGTNEVNKILSIYETRDGKLWRNWAFYPITRDESVSKN